MRRILSAWALAALVAFGSFAPQADAHKGRGNALSAAAGHLVKWNTGAWGLTFGQPVSHGATYSGSYNEGDVTKIKACANCTGYAMWMYWAGLESSTLGNWQFQGCTPPAYTSCGTTFFLDNMLNDLRTNGKKATLIIFDTGSFNAGTSGPTQNDNSALPGYITASANTGTYGTGQTGCGMSNASGAGGFYAQQDGSYSANRENPGVQAREIAMLQQLGAVYDGDPVMDTVMFTAMDFAYPCSTLSGLTGAPYYTAWENIITAARTAFPHTNISIQVAFDETGDAQSENFTKWLVATEGGAVSVSDTYGATAWTGYQSASGACEQSGGAFTGTPSGTSGTLASNWVCDGSPGVTTAGNIFGLIQLGGSSTQGPLSPTLTNGSTTITWTPSITGSPTNAFSVNPAPLYFAQQGMQAWFGIAPKGSGYTNPATSLQSLLTSFPLVEAGDMCADGSAIPFVGGFPVNYNPADILAAANLTGTNGYKASRVYFTILDGTQCTANSNAIWTNVVTAINATPLTNITYPTAPGY